MLKAKYTHPHNGYEIDKINCERYLKLGESYEVCSISMGQSHTHIFLKGIDCIFNSVNFDFYEDGEPIIIQRDPRYNPYLRRIV